MILTTNLQFATWIQLFGDERLTAALLDRLTQHAHIVELTGESFRFRQRMQEKKMGLSLFPAKGSAEKRGQRIGSLLCRTAARVGAQVAPSVALLRSVRTTMIILPLLEVGTFLKLKWDHFKR